ncbi:MAG TPA: hypothetical protein VLF91_05245 [Candidatus Saccharimonadales bacterium]|nr:hypothetical protein [Candidatus Saccharimonadales bacterium]
MQTSKNGSLVAIATTVAPGQAQFTIHIADRGLGRYGSDVMAYAVELLKTVPRVTKALPFSGTQTFEVHVSDDPEDLQLESVMAMAISVIEPMLLVDDRLVPYVVALDAELQALTGEEMARLYKWLNQKLEGSGKVLVYKARQNVNRRGSEPEFKHVTVVQITDCTWAIRSLDGLLAEANITAPWIKH